MPDRVKAILQHFRMTQAELAGVVGLNHSQVSSWINGRSTMPQTTAMAFQAALGVSWRWILYGEGEMLLNEVGALSEEERALLLEFRKCDAEGRREILEQARFNLGRSMRRWDIAQQDRGPLDWPEK